MDSSKLIPETQENRSWWRYVLRTVLSPILAILIIIRLAQFFFQIMYRAIRYGSELVVFDIDSVNIMWLIKNYLKEKGVEVAKKSD
jgi:hypothetical protein